MSGILAGAVGVLVLQALLVGGYLAVSRQDPIVLNPDRGTGRKRRHGDRVLWGRQRKGDAR